MKCFVLNPSPFLINCEVVGSLQGLNENAKLFEMQIHWLWVPFTKAERSNGDDNERGNKD